MSKCITCPAFTQCTSYKNGRLWKGVSIQKQQKETHNKSENSPTSILPGNKLLSMYLER